MKNLKAILPGLVLLLCQLHSSAQDEKVPINEPDYNKPKLFADLPQKMELKLNETEFLFRLELGAVTTVKLSENFSVEGTVVSKSDAKDASMQSVVIRCSNRQGAVFTLTRTKNAEGNFTYLGRIMNRNNGDAYEITREKALYVLVKKNLYDLISE